MGERITDREYRALAELRYHIRRFLQEGDATVARAGLEPQQYLLLLALRGLPAGQQATISTLAERLSLRHHSTGELLNRMEAHGYVRRIRDKVDRRQVLVTLQPKGERLLERVVLERISELRANGRELVDSIGALLESARSRSSARTAGRDGRARKL